MTTTYMMPEPRQRYYNNDGSLAAGCLLYTYAAGGSTPKATYTDSAGATPQANPIVLDAKGEAVIYWSGAYKVDLKTAAGVQITGYPVDNVTPYGSLIDTLRTDLAASSGAGLVGFLQAGTGAVAETVQAKLRESVSVKDFGAVGNGAIVAGAVTGTNDTTAINLAIAACGKTKTLFFPDGLYIVTPGSMSTIQCSVYGPGASFIGSSDGTLAHIFNLSYDEEYPVTLGTGVTGIDAWKTFHVHKITGSPNGDAGMSNVGIHCSHLNESQIYVDVIRGCNRGIHLDGSESDTHQGTNDIYIGHLYQCDVGFLGQGGTAGNMCEANRVSGRYWYGFTTAAISLSGGGTAVRVDNVFDIISIGVGIANGNGIMLDSLCRRNIFRVRSWDSGVSGTGKDIITAGVNNLFQIPALTMSTVTSTGTDIFDTETTMTDGNSRSSMSASAIPSSGTWRVGDKVWNNATATGTAPGWICTTAGAPGTWTEMQALAVSPKFKAVMSGSQAITAGAETTVIFDTATANVTASYNAANGVFQTSRAGYYQISTSVSMSATTMTSASIRLYKNGANDTLLQLLPTTLNTTTLSGSTLVYLNGSTDTISISGNIAAAADASFVGGQFSAVFTQST